MKLSHCWEAKGEGKKGLQSIPPPPLKKKLLIFGQIISLSFLKSFKQKGVSQTWIQFFSLYLRWTVRDVHGTQEVGMNDPPRSSFTKELFPLFVWPTTRRVDFLEAYDCRHCLSLSVIRSVFKLSENFSFILSINSHVCFEHSSKKEMREVKSLNCSSNDGAGNSSVSVSSLPEIPGFIMVKMLLSINYLGQLKEKGKL